MKIFGKIFIPVFVALTISAIIIGYTSYKRVGVLVDEQISKTVADKEIALKERALSVLQGVHDAEVVSGTLQREKALFISTIPFVRDVYTDLQKGNVDDPDDAIVRDERNRLKERFVDIEKLYVNETGRQDLRIHFHLANSRSFARVWRHGWQAKRNGKKVDISDDLSSFRFMIAAVVRSKKSKTGIELGRGGFVVRGLVPIFDNNKNIAGTVETYESYTQMLKNVELLPGETLSLLMPVDKLKITTQLTDTNKYPVLDDRWVSVYSSDNKQLKQTYSGGDYQNAYSQKTANFNVDDTFVSTEQVRDFSNNPIGMLVLTKNMADFNAATLAASNAGKEKRLQALYGTVGLLVVVVIVLTGIIYFIAGTIRKSTKAASFMLDELEGGNLNIRTEVKGQDEIAVLGSQLNRFADNLQNEIVAAFEALANGNLTFQAHGLIKKPLQSTNESLLELIQRLKEISGLLADEAHQLSDGSSSLADGATRSASSLEEVTATMTQMSGQVQKNAESAVEINQHFTDARQTAEDGNRQMSAMVTTMDEINQSSQNISKIINVIDEIAFQTNLLALNAAVEAARAGQHGKGFAVVAEEVRNLAARSAKAAEETAILIEGSVAMTDRGAHMAKETADALTAIMEKTMSVSDMFAELTQASSQQAHQLEVVTEGLAQIDKVTQQNSAISEESAAAAEELASQASQVEELLSVFKLPEVH